MDAARRLVFDAAFSSLVEAGSDFFLMPSRFEPCGLNQLISMRYGTPPIVRRVGGLRDTVTDASGHDLELGHATGITFDDLTHGALADAVDRACALHRDKDALHRVRMAGMRADWSWSRSATEYVALYEEALQRRRKGDHLEAVLNDLPPEPIEIELPELAEIPKGYARDVLTLVPFSPDTLFCMWELGGEANTARIAAISEEQRERIEYELVLTESRTGATLRHRVGGTSPQWFAKVEPGGHYSGELLIHIPGQPPERVLDAPAVPMPLDVYPEI